MPHEPRRPIGRTNGTSNQTRLRWVQCSVLVRRTTSQRRGCLVQLIRKFRHVVIRLRDAGTRERVRLNDISTSIQVRFVDTTDSIRLGQAGKRQN
jgi:hypothetical protein